MALGRTVLRVLLLLSATLWPAGLGCFQTLRTPPYETYWLPNQNSRFTGLMCLAVRGFRWTLKFIRVTYDHWRLEMDYAKCLRDRLGVGAALLPDPRKRNPSTIITAVADTYPRPLPTATSFETLREDTSVLGTLHSDLNRSFLEKTMVPRQSSSPVDLLAILRSWRNMLNALWQQFVLLTARAWRQGIFFCTKTYMSQAFWRWVDRAPFA